MKATIEKTKENICGSIKRTPGQNLMRAVTNSDQPIGIPPYNYGAMYLIFRQALTESEIKLLCKGFGFLGYERQKQNEIAKEFNVQPVEISTMMRKTISKLQMSPYKSQLRSLVPTLDEVFDEVINLRSVNKRLNESKASRGFVESMEKKCENLQTLYNQSEKNRKDIQKENEYLKSELKAANKRLSSVTVKLGESVAQSAKLTTQLKYQEAKADAVKDAFDDALDQAKMIFISKVSDATAKVDTFVDLGLSNEAINALKRAQINDLERLCGLQKRTLGRLGVKSEIIVEIERKLSERGLFLKAG